MDKAPLCCVEVWVCFCHHEMNLLLHDITQGWAFR